MSENAASALNDALDKWRCVVGDQHVAASGEEVDAANAATFIPSGTVRAIVRPATTDEVRACMRIAHELRVPVYPVSRGRNWGYGSRTPPLGSVVLLELRRMDRVIEFSEELGYVRVQPGVTFEQLWEFLESKGSSFQMDATSGPGDGSLLGNALERGRSHGPGLHPARTVGDFEVVLPDGRLIHTSSRRFPDAAHAATEPFPLGPDVTGLFFESNIGVVTEMTIWLSRKAKITRILFLGLKEQSAMRQIIRPVRDLMMDGVLLPQSVFMINDHRRRAEALLNRQAREQGPFERANSSRGAPRVEGLPPWPEEDFAWLCTVTIYASDSLIGQRRFEITKEALSDISDVVYEGVARGVGAGPNTEPFRIPYMKKGVRPPSSPDLDRDRIGYIFAAPVAPAMSDQVSYVYETMRDLMLEHGFDAYINMRFWEARSVVFVGSIIYDLDDTVGSHRAMECYRQILEKLGGRGYLPYRLPTFAMQDLPRPVDDWGSVWGSVKRALDPHDVLSPGRYDYRYCWPSVFHK